MSDNYQIEEQGEICIITLTKILNLKELVAVLDEVSHVTNKNRRVWITTGNFTLNSEDIRKVAERGKVLWPQNSRVAYVGEDDLSFGLLRIFEVFREEDNYETKIFREKSEAINWLKSWEHE